MTKNRVIRCVAFDLDGVVIPTAPSYAYFEQTHRITRTQFREFFNGPYALAMRGHADLFEVLPSALQHWHWPGTVENFAELWFQSAAGADPEVVEMVRTLRRHGIGCYMATNQDNRRAHYLESLPWLQELFERRFYSCLLGASKPSVEYFAAVQHACDMEGDSILFVDDKLENVEGARSAGWHAEQCTGAADLRRIVTDYFPEVHC